MASNRVRGRQVEVDMVEAIRNSTEYIRELSLVAEVDDHVVGHRMLGRKPRSKAPRNDGRSR